MSCTSCKLCKDNKYRGKTKCGFTTVSVSASAPTTTILNCCQNPLAGKGHGLGNVINSSSELNNQEVQAFMHLVQDQIINDFAPHWGAMTTLKFGAHIDKKLDYYVIITDDVDLPGALGYHDYSPCPPCKSGKGKGKPKSWSKVFPNLGQWKQTFSHEVMEMLADPQGNSFSAPLTLKDTNGHNVTGRFIMEICDPIEAKSYGGGLANFVLPNWYIPDSSGPWDILGHCHQALQTIGPGYADFKSNAGHWYKWSKGRLKREKGGNARIKQEVKSLEVSVL